MELKDIFDKVKKGDQVTLVTKGTDELVTNCADFLIYLSLYINKFVPDLVIFIQDDISTYSIALLCSTIEKVLSKTISIKTPHKYIT